MKIVTRSCSLAFVLSFLLIAMGGIDVIGEENSTQVEWSGSLTGDYYRYDLKLGVPETSGSGTLKGDVWGGTAAIKLPVMKQGDQIEVSYRRGRLDGRMHNDVFNLDGDAPTDLDMASIFYRWNFLTRSNSPVAGFTADLLIGANWVHEDLEWSAVVPNVAVYRSHFEQHVYTGNLGLSSAWNFWTRTSEDGAKRFRAGLGGDVIGGIGAQSIDKQDDLPNFPSFRTEDRTDQIWSFDSKGRVFADYNVGRFLFLVEGGYQWMRFFNVGANDTFHGPFARVGIGCSF